MTVGEYVWYGICMVWYMYGMVYEWYGICIMYGMVYVWYVFLDIKDIFQYI